MPRRDVDSVLDRLAERFVTEFEKGTGATPAGWGQFLDTAKSRSQVGPYGTAAALIVLGLANRSSAGEAKSGALTLCRMWRERRTWNEVGGRLSQNLRLAILVFASRLAGTESIASLEEELVSVVLERELERGGWGNWWVSADEFDSRQRPLVTALVTLALTLGEQRAALNPKVASAIRRALRCLEHELQSQPGPSDLVKYAASAALGAGYHALALDAAPPIPATLGRRPPIPGDEWLYFFDFDPELAGAPFGRDFFIVPADALVALAGYQPRVPAALRLTAEASLATLLRLSESGLFQGADAERYSTLNQAWLALALWQSKSGAKPAGTLGRLRHWLTRERKQTVWSNKVLPVMALFTATVATTVPDDGPMPYMLVKRLLALVLVGQYGKDLITRLLPRSR